MYLYGNVGSEWFDGHQLSPAGELFWLFFMKIVENIVEDQIVAVLVFRLK